MKGKLIKRDDSYWLHGGSGSTCATSWGVVAGRKLSLKNCQAIERGYDLEELVENFIREGKCNSMDGAKREGIVMGFQKAIEILGDKKFSEKKMLEFGKYAWKHGGRERSMNQLLNDYKAPQQTEWDVEIIMEEILGDEGIVAHAFKENEYKPKLDPDGCLILKKL